MKELPDKKTIFLTHYIFNPTIVLLPYEFDEVLFGLNVWPKGMMDAQKRELLKRDEFNLGNTQIIRGEPILCFKYAHETDKWTIVKSEDYQ